ncbi:MAG: peptidoglycan DD-metalloendopeptidase family protein [Flavobacteriaceae bacterium]|nr:peptidoglycan DD-metalloendopeptidase family protein [Flavobacteriaceae bacterium]
MDFLDSMSTNLNTPLYVLDSNIPFANYSKIDLSITNNALQFIDISSVDQCAAHISEHLKKNKAKVAHGGYLEERNLYKGAHNFIGTEQRTIHLGIDFWCDAGTKVLAVLPGEVHSFQNNMTAGNYGPTIILKHSFEGLEFYSLYGHLSLESLKGLTVGHKTVRGAIIGSLGSSEVNGGYAPHLHFQLIKDLQGNVGDYPGVCSKGDVDFYRGNCPDPNILLKLRKD